MTLRPHWRTTQHVEATAYSLGHARGDNRAPGGIVDSPPGRARCASSRYPAPTLLRNGCASIKLFLLAAEARHATWFPLLAGCANRCGRPGRPRGPSNP